MINYTTILSLLLSALIGAFVGHLLTKLRNKQDRFEEACKRFRDAFSEEIRLLKSNNEDACNIIKPAINRHESAMIEFKFFLKGKSLQQFEKAWNEYYYGDIPGILVPFPEQYFAGGSVSRRNELTNLALQRLEKLLSFAEQK